jgi:phage baseplate assembly protein W
MASCRGTIYNGFSISNYTENKQFGLNDIELVKRDLLNHIFTKPGERVMMPDFGSLIPIILFEPLDGETIGAAMDSIREIIKYDPRVNLVSLSNEPNFDTGELRLYATIEYVELESIAETLDISLQFATQ